jgi:hypothetical protein
MGLLSKIMKPIVRKVGGLEPRTPMPPRRKGGLAGLIQRVKDKRLQRPISIGGVGGGKIQPINVGRPVAPPGGIRPLPIRPPSIGGPGGGMVRPLPVGPGIPFTPPEQRPIARPILRREDIVPIRPREELIDMGVVAPLPGQEGRQAINPATGQPYTPTQEPEVGSDLLRPLPGSLRPPQQIRPDLLPPKRDPIMSIGGPGGGITDDRAISPLERPNFIGRSREQIDEMIERGAGALPQPGLELPPLIPQAEKDFQNTSIEDRLQFLKDKGIETPPNFLTTLPPPRDPGRYDSIGMPLIDPNMPIGDDSRRRPQPGEPGATPIDVGIPDPRTNMNIETRDTEFGPVTISSPAFNIGKGQTMLPPMGNNPPPTPDVGLAQPAPVTDPVTPTVDPVTTAPTPSATTEQGTDPIQSMPAPVGALDPVLLGQTAQENLNDPLVRALYFGTQDQPGFYQQLQQAGANLIGQDVPLQQTAGLTPLELLARQQAVAGLGGFEPFFQQNKDLIDQAIGQSRRAEALRDPYFNRAERQMQIGLGDELRGIREARGITTGATDRFGRSLGRLGRQQIGATDEFGRRLSDVEARGEGAAGRFGESLGGIETGAIGVTDAFGRSLGESEDLIRGTLGGYDQGMTQQFYNPFEDRVVQQTIDDVLEAGEKQDIASRAREISAGAFGGSRARLGAMERQEALGEGLAQALGRIRQQGFSEAQRTGLGEFARQREAERAASRGLSGLASTRLGAESSLFDRLTSGAQQRLAAEQGVVDLLGRTGQQQLGAQQQLGSTLRGLTGDQFGAQQQLAANLMGYGAAGAGARQNLATGLLGIGQQRGSGASALGQQLAGYGSQIGDVGSVLDTLRRGQRSELTGYGATGRGIAETGLSRIYQQQLGQQQRPLGVLGQIGSMLPGYQQTSTQIGSQYGLPTDPSAAGLGAAFSAYGSLAPRQEQG